MAGTPVTSAPLAGLVWDGAGAVNVMVREGLDVRKLPLPSMAWTRQYSGPTGYVLADGV